MTDQELAESIQEAVLSYYKDIVSRHIYFKDHKYRGMEYIIACHVSMYFCKKYTSLPLTKIGEICRGKHYASVIHGCNNVQNLLDTDKAFGKQLEAINTIIQSKLLISITERNNLRIKFVEDLLVNANLNRLSFTETAKLIVENFR